MGGDIPLYQGHAAGESGYIQGGSHLVRAACHLFLGTGIAVGGGKLVAGCCAPVVQQGVEGEAGTCIQGYAIDGLTHPLHIFVVSIVGADRGGEGSQCKGKAAVAAQLLGDDVFHGDGDDIAIGGIAQLLPCVLQVEGIAAGAGGSLAAVGTLDSLNRIDVDGVVNGVNVNGLRGFRQVFQRNLHPEIPLTVALVDELQNPLQIAAAAGVAHGQHQGLAGGGFVKAVGIQGGAHTLQGISGGDELAGLPGDEIRYGTAYILAVQPQAGIQGNVYGLLLCPVIRLLPLCCGTGSAKGASRLHRLGDVQGRLSLGGGKHKFLTGHNHSHIVAGIAASYSSGNGTDGLLLAHTPYIHTGNPDVGENFTAIGVAVGLDKNYGGNAHCQQQGNQNQSQIDTLAVAGDGSDKPVGFFPWPGRGIVRFSPAGRRALALAGKPWCGFFQGGGLLLKLVLGFYGGIGVEIRRELHIQLGQKFIEIYIVRPCGRVH